MVRVTILLCSYFLELLQSFVVGPNSLGGASRHDDIVVVMAAFDVVEVLEYGRHDQICG